MKKLMIREKAVGELVEYKVFNEFEEEKVYEGPMVQLLSAAKSQEATEAPCWPKAVFDAVVGTQSSVVYLLRCALNVERVTLAEAKTAEEAIQQVLEKEEPYLPRDRSGKLRGGYIVAVPISEGFWALARTGPEVRRTDELL